MKCSFWQHWTCGNSIFMILSRTTLTFPRCLPQARHVETLHGSSSICFVYCLAVCLWQHALCLENPCSCVYNWLCAQNSRRSWASLDVLHRHRHLGPDVGGRPPFCLVFNLLILCKCHCFFCKRASVLRVIGGCRRLPFPPPGPVGVARLLQPSQSDAVWTRLSLHWLVWHNSPIVVSLAGLTDRARLVLPFNLIPSLVYDSLNACRFLCQPVESYFQSKDNSSYECAPSIDAYCQFSRRIKPQRLLQTDAD